MLATLRADMLRVCDPAIRWQDAEWQWKRVLAALVREIGTWAVVEYRFRRWTASLRGLMPFVFKPLTFLSSLVIQVLTGISIATNADLGPGLYIGHFGGIVVGPGVRAGSNMNLSQNVTIGAHRGSPVIGDQVYLAPGAKVFGDITIGDNVAVGANAVVHGDVPAFATVVTQVEILPDRGNHRSSARQG